jgi:outer membrane protein OmpA-like peptidoglycan-associated protein
MKIHNLLYAIIFCLLSQAVYAQRDLLLNGNFEDINTCTEYKSECGVEGWFYLKDVKAQMLSNETDDLSKGGNSFGLFFTWIGYTGFSPIMGSILPCRLQKDHRYTFKGVMGFKMNEKLILQPGIALGDRFFVPKRPFAAHISPDTIKEIQHIPATDFYRFEYSFIATGNEKYLTFGTFIKEDTTRSKHAFIGNQSVSLILDNFQLIPYDADESYCEEWNGNKQAIYHYDYRHKDMDYALYAKGELPIRLPEITDRSITRTDTPVLVKPKADTLKLGDVFFDFNKADLKPAAKKMLTDFFADAAERDEKFPIDSIYIEGHTDSIGSDARNMQLSYQRCQTIREWLMDNHVVGDEQVQVRPFGKTKPVASNKTAPGRALNRRVEMIVFRKEK